MSQLTSKEKAKIKQLMGKGTADPKILKQVETIIKNALGKDGGKTISDQDKFMNKMGKAKGGKVKPKKMMGGKVAKKRMYGGSVKKSK